MFALGRPSGELLGGVRGRAGGLQARPWSQVRDYFYSSAHGTWPRVNDAICHPHPQLSSWQAPRVTVEYLGGKEEEEWGSFSGMVLAYLVLLAVGQKPCERFA